MGTLLGERYNAATGDESYDNDKKITSSTFDVTYYVQGSGPSDVLSTTGVPQIGSYLNINGQSYPSIRCINRRLGELDTSNDVWTVDCSFDSSVVVEEQSEPQDPVDVQPVWSWSYDTYEEELVKDAVSDIPVVNSMGEPFHINTSKVIPVLTIERYQYSFSPDTILTYANHVNSTTFWGAGKYKVLCSGITDNEADVNGVKLRKVQYVFKFKMDDDGWRVQVNNMGSRCRILNPFHARDAQTDDDKKIIVMPTDAEHHPIIVHLDKDGYELGKGINFFGETEPTLNNGGYIRFNKYDTVNFNSLWLGPW